MPRLLSCLLALVLIFPVTVLADVTININQGVNRPFQVAVVPFGRISHIVGQDLSHSGRFSVLPQSKLPKGISSSAMVRKWSSWQALTPKVDYALTGRVQGQTVIVKLYSIWGKRTLFAQEFTGIKSKQYRSLAHHISDLVYQTLTGTKGYFSTKIAYVVVKQAAVNRPRIYQLVISDQDGYNPQVLLEQTQTPIASPAWSPDGHQIAYVSYYRNRMAIFAIDLRTAKRKLLTNYPGINAAPAYSPSGKYLAVALSRSDSYKSDIYLLNLQTEKLRQLTRIGVNTSPAWAPGGKAILFTSTRSGQPQLWQVALNGDTGAERITYQGVQNFQGRYLPNGQGIVLMNRSEAGGPINIARLDLKSGQVTPITNSRLNRSPSLSPDGSMVAYVTFDKNLGQLAEASLNASVMMTLPLKRGSVESPSWSPYLI